jgi:hypothetical protein
VAAEGFSSHSPSQRRAAVTAVALSIPAAAAWMSRRSTPHGAGAVRVRWGTDRFGSANTGIEHMTLIIAAQNGLAQREAIDRQHQVLDFESVVKLFTADGSVTRFCGHSEVNSAPLH